MIDQAIEEAARVATGQDDASYAQMLEPVRCLGKNPGSALDVALKKVKEDLVGVEPTAFFRLRGEVIKLVRGLGVSDPRKVVEAALRNPAPEQGLAGGQPLEFADPEPWPESVEGTKLLTDLERFFRRFVVLPEGGADVLAAFVLATYAVEAFQSAPYVVVESPAWRCGKSRVLEVLEVLCRRPWNTIVPTTAVLFRVLEEYQPTLLLDECETVFGRDDRAEDVKAILRTGYKRGAKVARCVGDNHKVYHFDVFGPKVFALKGELRGALGDRCIRITMQRRRANEPIEKFSGRRLGPKDKELAPRAWRWASDHLGALNEREMTLEVPGNITDRLEEIWGPLFAVAQEAGGEWPERMVSASQQLLAMAREDDDDVCEQLLVDIREVFEGTLKTDRVASAVLVAALQQMESRPWADWKGKGLSPHALARLLKGFKIKPKQLRIGGQNVNGYDRAWFEDTWLRYVSAISTPTSLPCSKYAGKSVFQTPTADPSVGVSKSAETLVKTGNVGGVGLRNADIGGIHTKLGRTLAAARAKRGEQAS